MAAETFPPLHARSRGFTLGVPHGFAIAAGGDRALRLLPGRSAPTYVRWGEGSAGG